MYITVIYIKQQDAVASAHTRAAFHLPNGWRRRACRSGAEKSWVCLHDSPSSFDSLGGGAVFRIVKSQAADREIDDFMTAPRSPPG